MDLNTAGRDIPFWEQYTMTVEEASRYFRIGENKIRALINNNPSADFILRNGNRVLIKRKKFEALVDSLDEI